MPYLRRALAYFEKRRVTLESPCLSNFVPCVLPEHANLMAEWKYQKEDDILFVPNEGPKNVYKMKESQRMRVKRCDECAYGGVCMGFEREYYNYFGGGEFDPVAVKPDKFPLDTYYRG